MQFTLVGYKAGPIVALHDVLMEFIHFGYEYSKPQVSLYRSKLCAL